MPIPFIPYLRHTDANIPGRGGVTDEEQSLTRTGHGLASERIRQLSIRSITSNPQTMNQHHSHIIGGQRHPTGIWGRIASYMSRRSNSPPKPHRVPVDDDTAYPPQVPSAVNTIGLAHRLVAKPHVVDV